MIKGPPYWFKILIFPWILVFSLREWGPITYPAISEALATFIALFLFVAAVGYSIGSLGLVARHRAPSPSHQATAEANDNAILILSLLYIILSLVDFFIIKAGTLTTLTQIREQDNITGSRMSVLGGVVALTSAAPYIYLCKLSYGRVIHRRKRSLLTSFVVAIGITASFLSGGRNAFVIGMTVFFVQRLILARYFTFDRDERKNIRRLLIIGGILYSFYLFLERELAQGIDLNQLLFVFAAKWDVKITEVSFGNEVLDSIYASLMIFLFYLTHATDYIDQYFNSNSSPFLLGAYNFPVVSKLIDVVAESQIFSGIPNSLLVPGVYLTLPGSLYIDFGYFGALVSSLFLGVLTGLSSRNSFSNSFLKMQFSCFMACLWLLAPIYSIIGISNGFSFMIIIALLATANQVKKMLLQNYGQGSLRRRPLV